MPSYVYRGFTREDLDIAYDNTHAVLESSAILEGFVVRSEKLAFAFAETMNILYGEAPRESLDYFPGAPGAPLLVFIHGGYWQMRNKDTFRFLAQGPLALGFHVASIGYTLAPEMPLAGIVGEVRLAVEWLYKNASKFGADTSRIYTSGWSAGAHLAVSVLDMPNVQGALAVSGIYDLEPISRSYLNEALQLLPQDVLQLSPMRVPCVRKPVAVACGVNELPELRRQSLEFATLRARERIPGSFIELDGKNHFSILEELEKPNGSLTLMLKILADA